MELLTIDKIKVGLHLEMQKESDRSCGWFDWGVIERWDIPRLKREISRGLELWRIKDHNTVID